MSLRENRLSPTTSPLARVGTRPDASLSAPGSQPGIEHFTASSRLWGALHERLGRSGVASLLAEGPRDALELQILHIAGFVESTGVDASAYLPWNASMSWQDRTQPYYRALLRSLDLGPEEEAPASPLMEVGGLGSGDLSIGAPLSGGLELGLDGGLDLGLTDTMGSLDAFGGGWTGLGVDVGDVGAGVDNVSLSRDARAEGPSNEQALSSWFGGRLAAAGGGRALTSEESSFLQEIHGRTFGDVRIHEGPGARELSQAIAARAFTLGDHIFIGEGGDLLSSPGGAELLAHEVTHVAQGDAGRLPTPRGEGLSVSSPAQPHEREAEAIGRRARAVFDTFREGSGLEAVAEGWSLDASWDGDPVGAAVAAHLRATLPEVGDPDAELVASELSEGMRGRARSSLSGQHVLVDVAEALGEDPGLVADLRGALGSLESQVETAGIDELATLSGAPDLSAMDAGIPGFESVASGLLGDDAGSGFAPASGDGMGGLLFGGGSGGGEALSRKATHGADEGPDAGGAVDSALSAKGQGASLPADLQARLEARLGVSLAGVRLHTDARAVAAAEAVNAEAFTVGQDIYFNAGAFDPHSAEGVELIAHESTHVAQFLEGREGQASAVEGGIGVTSPGDAVEREAESVGSEIATEFAGGGLDSSMDISVDQSSPEASGAEGATGASEGLSVEPTAAPIEAEVGESLELAGSPAGSSAEGETVARSEKGGQFDIFGGQGGTGGGTTDAMKAITPLLEGMLQPGSKASLPAGMGDLARTLTPMIPGMAPLSPMIQAMASGVQTSTFTDMGPSGVMGVMAQGVPGLGDLVNVVESGLANVAGEGQGLGRGSLPEGSDTIGWIMQAVPGLAQLTSAFRGALAQQSGTGSGPTPGPATSEKSEAMTAGSQDRIMGLDVNQVVSSGIAQVGGPTTGAAAHGTSPMGRGVVDLLDTAMPGFSDFTRLVQDSQSGSVGLGHGQTQGSNQQQTGNQGMGFFQSLAQSGAVSGLRPDLVLHRTEGEGEQQGGEKKGWFDSVVDWGVNKVAEGTKMASDLTKGIPVLEQVTDAAGWIQNQSAQFTGGLLKGAGDMVGGLWNMASHIPGPAGTSMKMISNAIDVVQGNKSFGAAVNDTLNPMKSMEDDAKFWGGMGKGLFAMAEHLPGPIPFMPNPLKMAHNAYDVIAGNKTMSQALGSLNPLSSAAEDMQFWKQAGGAFLKPYTEAWKQGKYAEVLGRATFDIGSLFIGAGEVGAAGKVGEGARVLGEVGKTGEVLNTVTKVEEGVNIASKVEEGVNVATKVEEGVSTVTKTEEAVNTATKTEEAVNTATKVEQEGTKVSEVGETTQPDKITLRREDDNFAAQVNSKGKKKSFIDGDGNMVPADTSGRLPGKGGKEGREVTEIEHIMGMDPAKQHSAFTSFYTPGAGAKPYGANAVDLDIQRLMTDVQTGALKGVDVRSPEKLAEILSEDIAKIHDGVNIEQALKGDVSEYVKSLEGLKPKQAEKLENRLRALQNTQRDREWLIKGVIPSDYLTPFKP